MIRNGFLVLFICMTITAPSSAGAEDWYTGSGSSEAKRNYGVSIDASVSGTSQDSLHVSAIGTIAPFAPMDKTGFRFRIGGLGGSYKYLSTTPGVGNVRGNEKSGSLLAGYEWVMPTMSVGVFGGVEIQDRTLSRPDPNNKVVGSSFGVKTALDFYSNPTPYTMVSGNFTYSTNYNAYYARLKAGMAIFTQVFVGPELLFLGDNFYGQWRIGAHISGVKLGALQFGLSGGYANDRKNGGGAYGILDTQIRF